MKKITSIILLVLISFSCFAQKYKVIERSRNRAPKWISATEREYLITQATNSDLEKAKSIALSNIKQQISESVASRIIAESKYNSSSVESNDNFSFSQNFQSTITSRTAKLPFINEISLSKAEDFYWEKRYYKSTKTTEYIYALKYPFSDFQMKKMVLEFQAYDKKLDVQLAIFEEELNNIKSIEDIEKGIINLRTFKDEFVSEDPRSAKIETLINLYRKQYDYISINATQIKKGLVEFIIMYNGNPIVTKQKPFIKASWDMAKPQVNVSGYTYHITYDDEACYEEDANSLSIRLRIGSKFLSQQVFIKM